MSPPVDMARWMIWASAMSAVLCACSPDAEDSFDYRSLEPYPNRVEELTQLDTEQPARDKPRAMAQSIDGTRLFVALQGSVDEPGRHVAVVDTETMSARARPVSRSTRAAVFWW